MRWLSPVVRGLAGVVLLLAAATGWWWFAAPTRVATDIAYAAPNLDPLTPEEAMREVWRLTPELLLGIYDAFAETSETAIYDRLAMVASGDALVDLYLDRAGALAGGGLTESDQNVHEMQLTRLDTWRDGADLTIDATWQVIGTVGHDAHRHVRGNAYSATLSVSPVDGAWRLTGFDLRDVDRTLAGTQAPVAPGDALSSSAPPSLAADPVAGADPHAVAGDAPAQGDARPTTRPADGHTVQW